MPETNGSCEAEINVDVIERNGKPSPCPMEPPAPEETAEKCDPRRGRA